MSNNNLTFDEKTFGNWTKIFNEFVSDKNLHRALASPGKTRVPSPFNTSSKKDGFRFDKDFESKGGLGFCNSQGAMSGVSMIAFLNASNTQQVASQIHKFLDGKTIDVVNTRTAIELARNKANNQDLHRLDFSRRLISKILKQPTNNKFRDSYLKSRGLEKAIPFLNNDIRSIANLYYNKTTNLPAMVSVVRNEDNKIAFLHKTYLDDNGNKANIDTPKKVTYQTRANAYQRPFLTQVNKLDINKPNKNNSSNKPNKNNSSNKPNNNSSNKANKDSSSNKPNNNSTVEHVAEGIETALAVALITNNRDRVVSCINSHGMTMFKPRASTKQVCIWADNDTAGIKAAQTLQQKLLATNKTNKVKVQVLMPRQRGNDFLDELNIQQNNPNYKIQFNNKANQHNQAQGASR